MAAYDAALNGPDSVMEDDPQHSVYQHSRLLFVVRHSERMDYEYGNQWITHVTEEPTGTFKYELQFTDPPEYETIDIPRRAGGLMAFRGDTPLTPTGHEMAQQVGSDLKRHGFSISHIYSSPALRCVQTAHRILQGLGVDLKIHVEPGLFELLSLRPVPTFLTLGEMVAHGFPVDTEYSVIWPESRYNAKEKRGELYQRSHLVTQEIVEKHRKEGGNILIVAHAASLDTCVRRLLGKKPASNHEFYESLNSEYCEVKLVKEKYTKGKRTWVEGKYNC